jgi:tripartite-type tricarboxylate transporter receptor subunit TctC
MGARLAGQLVYRYRYILVLALCCAMPAVPAAAQETFPSRPVQLIVPFPHGGALDIVSRQLAEKYRKDWGQPVLVLNRPGANGVRAWQGLLNTRPDGYSVLSAGGQGLGYVHLMDPSVPGRFLDHFTEVAAFASFPLVFLVHKDVPVATLLELAAHAAKHPKTLGYGTTGAGSGGHVVFELFKSAARVPKEALLPVHYAGIAPEITALAAGQIQAAIMPLTSIAAAQIDAGTIRALAVSAPRRSPFRKEIATVGEMGFPNLVSKEYISHWVLAKTPAPVVKKLADAARRATEHPETRKQFEALYLEAEFLDGPELRRQFEKRAAEFEPVLRKLGLRTQ